MKNPLQSALAFFLELAMLAALSVGGFHMGTSTGTRLLLGVLVPVCVIVFWGIWMAPRARRRLKMPWLSLVALCLFEWGAWMLYTADHPVLAAILGGLALVNLALTWRS